MSARRLGAALLVLLLAPQDAEGRWRGIERAENHILFAGAVPDADREAHRHLRLEDSGGKRESYQAHWVARGWNAPLLRLRLHRTAADHPYRSERKSLESLIKTHPLFRGLAYSAIESGDAESALGPAEYLVFEAGRYRCGTWRIYPDRRAGDAPDMLGDTLMTGLYCPVSRAVDAASLAALLARTGIRGVAAPEAGAPAAPPPGPEALARLVKSGDMAGLRRLAARGLDPDSVIPFGHPRFAGGRTIRRPMIVAAALFGHVETAVFLLELGAATGGAGAGAICAAVARDHPEIAEALLDADPALAQYRRCGRGGELAPLALARLLERAAIVEILEARSAR